MICAWRALMSQRRGMTQPVVLFVSVTAPFSMPAITPESYSVSPREIFS